MIGVLVNRCNTIPVILAEGLLYSTGTPTIGQGWPQKVTGYREVTKPQRECVLHVKSEVSRSVRRSKEVLRVSPYKALALSYRSASAIEGDNQMTDIITLKEICAELKIKPRVAREKRERPVFPA